jgi:hypothetical protein
MLKEAIKPKTGRHQAKTSQFVQPGISLLLGGGF